MMYIKNQYRVVNQIFRRQVSWMLILMLLLIPSAMPVSVSAQEKTSMTDIRVGLKGLYADVSSIKINNKKIGLGYCIGDSYICETEFISSTGFTFQAETGNFYITEKTYKNYNEAKTAAEAIKSKKIEAYPVSVYRNSWKVYVSGITDISVLNTLNAYHFTESFKDNKHRIKVLGEQDTFLIDGEVKNAYPQFKALTSNNQNAMVMDLGNRQYRGRIEIGRYGNARVTAVNIINIEAYLYSVVPSEMPGSWPFEALKAQALCSRSFALSKAAYSADSNIFKAYYIDDTTNSQMYIGYSYENSETTRAVNSTRGEVITYNGNIIPAYFFSTSGGSTEDSYYVWGSAVPYLKSMPDLYEMEPEKEPWVIKMTKSQLLAKLGSINLGSGSLKNITAQLSTSSGRVYILSAARADGTVTLRSGTIRSGLGFPSTKFKIIKYGDVPDMVSVKSSAGTKQVRISESYILSASGLSKADSSIEQFVVKGSENMMNYPVEAPKDEDTYYFAGMGYGHGVGMSQSGAKGMASYGFNYNQIIRYYYQGCKIIVH